MCQNRLLRISPHPTSYHLYTSLSILNHYCYQLSETLGRLRSKLKQIRNCEALDLERPSTLLIRNDFC